MANSVVVTGGAGKAGSSIVSRRRPPPCKLYLLGSVVRSGHGVEAGCVAASKEPPTSRMPTPCGLLIGTQNQCLPESGGC
jgi:hypothetical protein